MSYSKQECEDPEQHFQSGNGLTHGIWADCPRLCTTYLPSKKKKFTRIFLIAAVSPEIVEESATPAQGYSIAVFKSLLC